MKVIGNALLALFRPAKGIDGLGSAIKWIWVPFAVLLVATVLIKTVATGPLMLAAEQKSRDEIISKQMESMSEEEKVSFERDMAQTQEQIDTSGIVMTASVVFGIVGALAAILATALFFLIAAKTSANPVGFGAMLSVAGLSFAPHAIRNIVQTVVMSGTQVWQEHAGMSSLAVPADPSKSPNVLLYGFLSQIDIWVVWGIAILFGALTAKAIGFEKKRALTTVLAFVAVALLIKMVPLVLSSVLGGGSI